MDDTQKNKHKQYCIHQLFEEQAQRRPDAAAVISGTQSVTYKELNERSNRFAHYLRGLNVGPGKLAGICLERSAEMLIALLGILKAGAAYVPLDPDFPRDRLEYMAKDARLSVLVTQKSLVSVMQATNATTVCIDTEAEQIKKLSAESPGQLQAEQMSGPEDLAYVIYTSGSTGTPKGVQVHHSAVVNFLCSMAQKPGISEDDILVAVTTLSFDISVLELFLPLSQGACTVIASRDVAADGKLLLQTLQKTKATVMQATPVTWRMLIGAGWNGSPQIKVLCGGEAVPRDLANELIDRSPSVWNMYGPTETTVWSTSCQLQDKQGPVMIGRPIANTPVYILDQHLQPVPLGVSGELYIGGAGVSRGYLNRPDLTEKAFVKNPFSPDPSAVMYKTGDLTRYYANGNIEFLGRIDQQIKIRGFRVELGEIETVLLEHPSIKQGVVIVREDRPGDARLVAYMVHAEGLKIDSRELRQFLRKKLPDYMIPQHFVELDTLPRTPNGKINRKALPKPDASMQADDNYKEPQTAIEKQLAAIWADILGTKRVGLNDSFFELGGHSVLAIQVVSAVRDSLSVDLPLRAIFETPILIDLAQHIEALRFAFSAATEKAEGSTHEREEIEI